MKKLSEKVLSRREQKRLEYTAHQKAIYDHNTLIEENWMRGKTEERKELAMKMRAKG